MILSEWEARPLVGPVGSLAAARDARESWTDIEVPGHWQLDEDFAGYEGTVLYRCRFAASPAATESATTFLRFDGVYYSARVWLNGVYLGDHEGYFSAFEFDVTKTIAEGENELFVEVWSPAEPDENDRRTIGGVWAMWDGMAAYYNPGGIYREVSLLRVEGPSIRRLGATADHEGKGKAFVEVHVRHGGRTTLDGRILPVGFDSPVDSFRKEVWAEPGVNRFEVEFQLSEVHAWWTWDRGEQPLYELALKCGADEMRVRFGARTVELRDWTVYLNGERLFLRGVNYLPTDVYPARASEDQLRADAALAREANMNAVRVHAHVVETGFYEACDEMGILILQDFPLQWTHRRSILKAAVTQAGEMARDLQSHPSVAIYLAHDEPFFIAPPEKWNIFGLLRTTAEVLSPRWLLWQRRVLDPAVMRAISEQDRSRPMIDAAGHPLTTNHLYFGWYYGNFRDLEKLVKILPGFSRLPTEYGAQALPDAATLDEIWPANKEPDWENLSINYRLQVERMLRYVPWRGDRQSFVRESQEYQAKVLKHATEFFRRRKYRPTGGTFAFMLNDPAPAISWSVVDWRRRPKAAFEALKSAMQQVLVCVEYPKESYEAGEKISLPLFIVNDLRQELGETVVYWSLRLENAEVASGCVRSQIPGDSVVRIGELKAGLPASGNAEIRLCLAAGDVKSRNTYRFRVV